MAGAVSLFHGLLNNRTRHDQVISPPELEPAHFCQPGLLRFVGLLLSRSASLRDGPAAARKNSVLRFYGTTEVVP
jgi:hypothetical protein